MELIVGLGNPEEKYKNTFHNLGFMAADKVAEELNVSFNKIKCKAMIAEARIGAEKVIIAKPLTYMNLSGESVRELMSFYKIPIENVAVISDDYDLYQGFIRVRSSGSAGTHNGLKNIVKETGSENFARIRIGFKPKVPSPIPLIDYVLSGIKAEDKEVFEKATSVAAKAAEEFAKGTPFDIIMQKYNGEVAL